MANAQSASSPSATQGSGGQQGAASAGKQADELSVRLLTDPSPPIRGNNNLEAIVTDAEGNPISDATVSFDIDMTNMSHGKKVVTASPLGEGRYSGKVSFLMAGPWRVIVSVECEGQTNTVRFDFNVNS